MSWYTCILAILWSAIAVAHNHDPPESCDLPCPESALWDGHGIPPGGQLKFDYKSVVVNNLPSLSEDGSGLKFKMTLVLTQTATCWLVLNVENVTVYYYKGNWPRITKDDHVLDPSLTATYSEALSQFPLWYKPANGVISCLQWHMGEPLWVRNFKRGLLTNFQLSPYQPEMWETGVTGTCRVKQTVDSRDDKYITRKIYDTSSCINRPQQIKSPIKLNPLFNPINSALFSISRSSEITVEYVKALQSDLFTSVVVEEQHIFKPFGHFKGGTVVFVKQEYTLLQDSLKLAEVPTPPRDVCRSECSSMIFEYEEQTLDIKECPKDLVNEIKEMIALMSDNWKQPEQIQYGKQFLKLVHLLRKACLTQLETLWNDSWKWYEDKVAQFNEIYFDALAQVGTDQSVTFLTEKMLEGILTVQRASFIMADMYFYSETTHIMLKEIQQLAKADWASIFPGQEPNVIRDLQYQSWLLLGSAIQDVERHPVKNESVYFLMHKLEYLFELRDSLINGTDNISVVEHDIKAILNAMENAASIESYDILMTIARTSELPSEIRTTAIAALRGLIPWKYDTILDGMATIFNDRNTSSTVRIASWDILAETQSSSYATAYHHFRDTVQKLENETDFHVGSYVFSWLLDWADHSEIDEYKAQLAQLTLYSTGAIYWGQKFKHGYLYSKYDINSWSPLSSGEVAVSTVVKSVFKLGSTLPHSAVASINIHLFGQQISLLQVEAEATGADWMLEYLFGPNGYFATGKTWNGTSGIENLIKDIVKPFEDQKLNGAIRLSLLGKRIFLWSRNHQWLEKFMMESPLYSTINSLWWIFSDNGYDMMQPCLPWTIESPQCHHQTGWTWPNIVDVHQRWRELTGFWKFLYDGTIWDEAFNMDFTRVLMETNISIPSVIGLPVYVAGEIMGHMNVETFGEIYLPSSLSTDLWPQSLWNHLCQIWNMWTGKPQEYKWKAYINPRLTLESYTAVGVDAHFGGSKLLLQMAVTSNHNFSLDGSAIKNTISATYDISKPNVTFASYSSELDMVYWNQSSVIKHAVTGYLPLEEGCNCTAKELLGVELCLSYQYYSSSNPTWAPSYPLNGPSSTDLTLLSFNSVSDSCDNCSCHNSSTCCKYHVSPTSITATISKNDWNDFTFTVEGDQSVPKREIRMDYLRETNGSTQEWITTDISWNVDECSYQLDTPQIYTYLQWRWDCVDVNAQMRGKGVTWELESMNWLNRTHFTSTSSYWNYEETEGQCLWVKPSDPYVLVMDGSLINHTKAGFWFELQDTCRVKHWLNASMSLNHLLMSMTVNSSFLDEPGWELGTPLPYPIDTASCHMFGNNFITFDRLHYATRARGRFVLAEDTLNSNFSVIVQKDETQVIVEVWIAGTNYAFIPPAKDFRPPSLSALRVNGIRERIPYKSCVVDVTALDPPCDGSYLRLTSRVGLEVYYKPEGIEISVNGFYYQHMRGLCGNNNNKVTHEWQMPNNTLATTPEQFVDSWQVEGSASEPLQTASYSKQTYEICKKAFSSKTMEPVGHEIDLRQFFHACLVEVENRSPKTSQWRAVCKAIDGLKVAAFTRDFTYLNSTSPLGCLYDEWRGWKTVAGNPDLEVRYRRLRGRCDDDYDCCPTEEKEYRKATGLGDNYECEPWMFQYIWQQLVSKTCVSTAIHPTCPKSCWSLKTDKATKTEFMCGSSNRKQQVRTPVYLPYQGVVKCICPTDCN